MELQRSADDAQESSSKELMAIHRQHRMSMADPAHEDLRRKVLDLTRDLEILKAEVRNTHRMNIVPLYTTFT